MLHESAPSGLCPDRGPRERGDRRRACVHVRTDGGDARRHASLGESLNNLKQFAWAGSAFTADNDERVWSFTWRAGQNPSKFEDLQVSANDLEAAENQAADILRRRVHPDFPRIPNWIPHIMTSHLVLADHLDLPEPLPWVISPADSTRLAWQQWPDNPIPLPTEDPTSLGWIYSSSYEFPPAFWTRDQRSATELTIQQATTHATYQIPAPQLPMGDRLITQIVHPSRKAMMYEMHQRYFGTRVVYFTFTEARVPVLTTDRAASVRATSEANLGFRPNAPANAGSTSVTYSPAAWEPPQPDGLSSVAVGRYRWTRGGLTGRDIGAPEVCTGQPGCVP